MLTSQMGIMAPNASAHTAVAFLRPKLPLSPQCEQGLIRWSNMVISYITDARDVVLATLRISAYI